MKNFAALAFILIFQTILFPQLNKLREMSAYYTNLNALEIQLREDSIILETAGTVIYSENITGKKQIEISGDGEYFFIANYGFFQGKEDYALNISVFNKTGVKVSSYTKKLYYDLPHPIYKIDDKAQIISFDPMSFKVTVISPEGEYIVDLAKDIEPNMERECYVEINRSSAYIFTSLTPDASRKGAGGAILFKVNINDRNFLSVETEIEVPSALKVTEDGIIASGVNFYNLTTIHSTHKFSEELLKINSSDIAGEKIIETGDALFFKFGNSLFKTDTNLNLLNNLILNTGERIIDFVEYGNGFALLTNRDELYQLTQNLEVEKKFSLDISYKFAPRLEKQGNKLLLHIDDFTIIYN